jgi:uncharacterized protein (TIGR03067 family)
VFARFCVSLVTALLFVTAAPAQTDKEKLQGEWRRDIQLPKQLGDGDSFSTLNVKGNEWVEVVEDSRLTWKANLRLDPSKDPKEMNLKSDRNLISAIYKLDGDTLTICYAVDLSVGRPTELKGGNKTVLLVYKRVTNK